MHQLNIADSQVIIYYPDINLENFVYNEREKRIKIIDLEYVILIEREVFNDTRSRSSRPQSQWCHRYRADYNIEQGRSSDLDVAKASLCGFSLSIYSITDAGGRS